MESHFLDVVGDILKALHLGLLVRVHHSGDCVDGGGECVELLLEPCDQQNWKINKRVDHLRKVQESVLTDNWRVKLYQLILGSGQGSLGVLQHHL